MKKRLMCAPILVSLFTNICSMENHIVIRGYKLQESKILTMPDEIKFYVFEMLIKDVIENNSIFEPSKGVKKVIANIILVNKEFNNFESGLIKFAEKYLKEYFAAMYIGWLPGEKDAKLEKIFVNNVENNNEELEIEVAKLIIAGANPNLDIDYSYDYFLTEANKVPLLMAIAKTGKFKNLIKLLISYGADVNLKDKYGNTALMRSVKKSEHKDIVKLLISAGADVNVQNDYGETALVQAVRYQCTDIVKLLIDAEAYINTKNKHGETALMKAAAIHGNINIVKLLVDAKADVNARSDYGDAALNLAKKNGYVQVLPLIH